MSEPVTQKLGFVENPQILINKNKFLAEVKGFILLGKNPMVKDIEIQRDIIDEYLPNYLTVIKERDIKFRLNISVEFVNMDVHQIVDGEMGKEGNKIQSDLDKLVGNINQRRKMKVS